MPWKNGMGLTREIAVDPPDASLSDPFRWRLSIAEVRASGPFSAFPGYDRTIMVIAGQGMELTVGDQASRKLDRQFEPFVFSGDEAANCRLLDGPIRDFNLMAQRSSLQSRLEVMRLDALSRPTDRIEHGSSVVILHCFEGSAEVKLAEQPWTQTLSADRTFIADFRRAEGGVMNLRVLAGRSAVLALIRLGK